MAHRRLKVMIGGEYRSDCDCDFSIKCFFLYVLVAV